MVARLWGEKRVSTTPVRTFAGAVVAVEGKTVVVFVFIARVRSQFPEPREHGIHYFGAYSVKRALSGAKRKLALAISTRERDTFFDAVLQLLPEPKGRGAVELSAVRWELVAYKDGTRDIGARASAFRRIGVLLSVS